MKKFASSLILLAALFAPLTYIFAADFPSELTQYEQEVKTLIAAEQDSAVKSFLSDRLTDAQSLDGIAATDPHLPDALSTLVQKRLVATSSPNGVAVRRFPGAISEFNSYRKHFANYLGAEYAQLVHLQDELLKRKYFQTETAENANYLEGIVNSYWGLTRAEQGDPKKILSEDTLGIKPWEAIVRLEPTLAMRGGPQGAIIGTAGLSYAFFPEVDRSDPTAIKFKKESFASGTLKKSGARAGVGAARLDGKTKLLVGAGTQINALGIWCLYEPKHRIYMLGLSTADLSKLQKWIGWFK